MKYFIIHLAACVAAVAETVLYQAAVIHTADRGVIENGQMLVQGDRITAVGKMVQVPRNARTVNLGKLQVYPGLIAATTSLGLTEINAVRATQDTTEVGEFTPDVEAWISVNPDSELIRWHAPMDLPMHWSRRWAVWSRALPDSLKLLVGVLRI